MFCTLDSIYTERYMGMPDESDNIIGYKVKQQQHEERHVPTATTTTVATRATTITAATAVTVIA